MTTSSTDISNPLFTLAVQLVNHSNRSVFLTGKAGTGKTTFLKHIRENCSKQLAVVAPTGVAAINAGGVTIHSFFQLPVAPFIPAAIGFEQKEETITDKHSLISRLRFNQEKRKVLQQLELLVIDEISMVRCDILDAIDTVLRHVRHRFNQPFGGVQLLFIGDMFQLPPVIRQEEWGFLSPYYQGPYFFNSLVMQQQPPVYVEFEKIYRQKDAVFIDVLNKVRNNQLDQQAQAVLEKRYQPAFRRQEDDGYIILTTHNKKAEAINGEELKKLKGQKFIKKAEAKGDFPEKAYPADPDLELKIGAQVMFIRNDQDKARRYFNGKIGWVKEVNEDLVIVECKDEEERIEVSRHEWKNIRYTLNKTSRQLDEEELGTFVQFPLRLAWAITIHKSQGLTFEKAIIDAGEAFAPGQVYVALSRCTTLNGLVLQSRIKNGALMTDKRIVEFSKAASSVHALTEEVARARQEYEQEILLSCFDFTTCKRDITELQTYCTTNKTSFNDKAIAWIGQLDLLIGNIEEVAAKFRQQLNGLLPATAQENETIQKRIDAAIGYFKPQLSAIRDFIKECPLSTDSKLHAKQVNDELKELFNELALKTHLIEYLQGSFSLEKCLQARKEFVAPSFYLNTYAAETQVLPESPHPQLLSQLRKLRDAICAKKGLPVYLVAASKTIEEMAAYLPHTLGELKQVHGFGDAKVDKYGQQFLDLILNYCDIHELDSRMPEQKPAKKTTEKKKGPKEDTRQTSFLLYKEGLSIAAIAEQRKLTKQTIEGHLAYFVEKGQLPIEELVSNKKRQLIEPLLEDFSGGPISAIKEKLGPEISFGEIKLVLAAMEFRKAEG